MAFLQNPEDLLELIKEPLSLLERFGINPHLESIASGISDRVPTDTSALVAWFENLWNIARGITSGGDVLGGLWALIKELLGVVVGLLGALADLLRSLLERF